MPKLIVHPKKTIRFRGIEVPGGTAVEATEKEELEFAGLLLTEEEFEAVCIDMHAAAQVEEQKRGEALMQSIDAQRIGVSAETEEALPEDQD